MPRACNQCATLLEHSLCLSVSLSVCLSVSLSLSLTLRVPVLSLLTRRPLVAHMTTQHPRALLFAVGLRPAALPLPAAPVGLTITCSVVRSSSGALPPLISAIFSLFDRKRPPKINTISSAEDAPFTASACAAISCAFSEPMLVDVDAVSTNSTLVLDTMKRRSMLVAMLARVQPPPASPTVSLFPGNGPGVWARAAPRRIVRATLSSQSPSLSLEPRNQPPTESARDAASERESARELGSPSSHAPLRPAKRAQHRQRDRGREQRLLQALHVRPRSHTHTEAGREPRRVAHTHADRQTDRGHCNAQLIEELLVPTRRDTVTRIDLLRCV